MNILRKSLAILLFSLVAPACMANEIVIFDGEKEITPGHVYEVTVCKNISLADCTDCVDSPSYYFNTESKQLISRCSGACWHPQGKQREVCKTLCPPPQWDCRQ